MGVNSTPHTNPNWLSEFKQNFRSEIIDKCSANVRLAVYNNIYIDNRQEKRDVKNMILQAVVTRLVRIFGGVSSPKLNEAREIVAEMQFVYPALFKDDISSGYGFGGHNGVSRLATHLVEACRRRTFGKSRGWDRKGKKKTVYGVNNFLWYMAKGPVSGSNTLTSLLTSNYCSTYVKREKVFEDNRSELTALLRDYHDSIPGVCRKFFSDYRHLENQFMYLTNTMGRTRVVDNNISKEMTNLEVYLGYTVGMAIPNTGSTLERKYVEILRHVCEYFDNDAAGLVRVAEDSPIPDD